MLLSIEVPKVFWVETIVIATYLTNKCPSMMLDM